MGWRQNIRRETPQQRERRIWGDPNREWEGEAPSGGYKRRNEYQRTGIAPRPAPTPPALPIGDNADIGAGAVPTPFDIGPRYVKTDAF